MEYLLEREVRLEKSEYENLYDWALQEYDKNGKEIGSPKIPAELSFWFTSTKISYHRKSSKEILEFEEGEKASFSDSEFIEVELAPGSIRYNDKGMPYLFDDLYYSFFGTGRSIDSFHLSIKKLNNEQDEDMAVVYGIPSYKYDEKITEDSLEINLFLNEGRFSDLVESIKNNTISHIEFNAEFPGFYFDWSPSEFYGQFLSEIKILSEDEDGQVVGISEGLNVIPKRLGELHNFSLTEAFPVIKSHSFFKIKEDENVFSESFEDDSDTPSETLTKSDIDSGGFKKDFQVCSVNEDTLSKLKTALWLIVFLLLLISIQIK